MNRESAANVEPVKPSPAEVRTWVNRVRKMRRQLGRMLAPLSIKSIIVNDGTDAPGDALAAAANAATE